MNESILLISETEGDEEGFSDILDNQYDISRISFNNNIEKVLNENRRALILADLDLIHDRINLFYDLQQSRSKACLILYGNSISSEELGQILHKGIYAYIPREFLAERLKGTILGGLENRRAFIEILDMTDNLRELNTRLESEKEALKKRNQQLSFINRLSSEISYDVNWDRILQRMIDAGLEATMEYRFFGLLFEMGSHWNLTLHMGKPKNIAVRDEFISDIIDKVNSDYGQEISIIDTDLNLISMNNCRSGRMHNFSLTPLDYAGKILGYILYEAKGSDKKSGEADVLLNTLSNMLSLSLKNAQEYFILKEAAVTDSLTGIYNRKGLFDFLAKELPRAERYKKSISFVMTDMDDFKRINDSMGHQAGDYVLKEFALILKKSFRQPDIVSRFGGDEFSILLPETELSDAHSIMTRVMENLSEHTFEWNSQKFKLRMSYGISSSNELSEQYNPEELIRLADSRLYKDKAHK
ncbi:MAG: diguanylate cyclase [Desulfobacteraceae bacterium]|jgi:diguanylate cyclase (GGDEF)-like protein